MAHNIPKTVTMDDEKGLKLNYKTGTNKKLEEPEGYDMYMMKETKRWREARKQRDQPGNGFFKL